MSIDLDAVFNYYEGERQKQEQRNGIRGSYGDGDYSWAWTPYHTTEVIESYQMTNRGLPRDIGQCKAFLDSVFDYGDGHWGKGRYKGYAVDNAVCFRAYRFMKKTCPNADPWFDSLRSRSDAIADANRTAPGVTMMQSIIGYLLCWMEYYDRELPPWAAEMETYVQQTENIWMNDSIDRLTVMMLYLMFRHVNPWLQESVIKSMADVDNATMLWPLVTVIPILNGINMIYGPQPVLNDFMVRSRSNLMRFYQYGTVNGVKMAAFSNDIGGKAAVNTTYWGLLTAINSGLIPGNSDPLWEALGTYHIRPDRKEVASNIPVEYAELVLAAEIITTILSRWKRFPI